MLTGAAHPLHAMTPDPDVLGYYESFAEETRLLTGGATLLEFERTKDILARVLPPPPATVLDVGGAAGAYSTWLAARGYDVHLVDLSQRLVDEARRRNEVAQYRIASITTADACNLPFGDCTAVAVLLMGPLYHLPAAEDRRRALREAHRVLKRGGLVAAAAISRYASTLDGLARRLSLDPQFRAIRDQDLRDGQHRNTTGNSAYFTTAYFHRPADLRQELEEACFVDVRVLGVEGPAWILPDLDQRWSDTPQREDILHIARALEAEDPMVGASAHLLGLAVKP